MATSVTSYPKIGTTAWRALRARAVTAPSTKFNPANAASILSYDSAKSAADNVVYPMQKLGLIDESGTLTERGNKWRNDASYAEACLAQPACTLPDRRRSASVPHDAGDDRGPGRDS